MKVEFRVKFDALKDFTLPFVASVPDSIHPFGGESVGHMIKHLRNVSIDPSEIWTDGAHPMLLWTNP